MVAVAGVPYPRRGRTRRSPGSRRRLVVSIRDPPGGSGRNARAGLRPSVSWSLPRWRLLPRGAVTVTLWTPERPCAATGRWTILDLAIRITPGRNPPLRGCPSPGGRRTEMLTYGLVVAQGYVRLVRRGERPPRRLTHTSFVRHGNEWVEQNRSPTMSSRRRRPTRPSSTHWEATTPIGPTTRNNSTPTSKPPSTRRCTHGVVTPASPLGVA
jgi:hypothetical protein